MRWYQYIEAVLYVADASTSRAIEIYNLGYQIACFSLPRAPIMEIKLLL